LCGNKEIGWKKGKREIKREKKEKRKISQIEKVNKINVYIYIYI